MLGNGISLLNNWSCKPSLAWPKQSPSESANARVGSDMGFKCDANFMNDMSPDGVKR